MFPSTRSGEFLAISLAYKGNLFSSTQIMNWPHKGGNYRLMLPFNGPPAWIAPNRDTHRNHKLNESEQWNRWTWTEWSGNVYCIFFLPMFIQLVLGPFGPKTLAKLKSQAISNWGSLMIFTFIEQSIYNSIFFNHQSSHCTVMAATGEHLMARLMIQLK